MHLRIRHRDGVESLTTLEEGEFKVPIDGCISLLVVFICLDTSSHFSNNLVVNYCGAFIRGGRLLENIRYIYHLLAVCSSKVSCFHFQYFFLIECAFTL